MVHYFFFFKKKKKKFPPYFFFFFKKKKKKKTFTFIMHIGFFYHNTRIYVRLLGPCFKTGQ